MAHSIIGSFIALRFVTVKAAMTLDGKIATASGESMWITSERSREHAMELRQGADATLVGVNTVLADDPSLTIRPKSNVHPPSPRLRRTGSPKSLRRIVLDSLARTPLTAKVICDDFASLTTIVVTKRAPKNCVAALAKRVNVLVAPAIDSSSRCAMALKEARRGRRDEFTRRGWRRSRRILSASEIGAPNRILLCSESNWRTCRKESRGRRRCSQLK